MTGWCDLPNHPDVPEPLTGPDGDVYGADGEPVEDFVDYLVRVSGHLSEHPPAAPSGFWLVRCVADPRHWPEYVPVTNDFYEPLCSACVYGVLQDAHDGCRHSHHGSWRRWRITKWALSWGYAHGLVAGYGTTHDAHCAGCVSGVKWGRSQWFKEKRNEGAA